MLKSLFITTSEVRAGTGGGIVSYNIALALKESTDLQLILCDGASTIAPSININPAAYGQPNSVFLWDYFASQFVKKVDLAHIRGDPFGVTVQKLKKMGAKVVVDVPAHNAELSIEEFKRVGLVYPFRHMIDERLWKMYSEHVNLADVVAAPSTLSRDYILNSGRFKVKGEVVIIPHGCEIPDRVTYVNEMNVGYMGAIGPDKGVIYLIEAMRKVNANLVLAGRQTEYINIKDKNLARRTKKLGYVKNISDFYNSINIYVQSSITEGFGLEVLEAMAHGRPVIVTEGVGAKDLVEDGKNGFIVPIRNPDAIAEKIQYFIDNPSEIFRMGQNAREKAKLYTWENVRRLYMNLYEELCR